MTSATDINRTAGQICAVRIKCQLGTGSRQNVVTKQQENTGQINDVYRKKRRKFNYDPIDKSARFSDVAMY